MLKSGIYEQVINKFIARELEESNSAGRIIKKGKLDEEESSRILAKYISEIIEHGLDCVIDKNKKIESQIDLVNKLVDVIRIATQDLEIDGLWVDESAEQLLALINKSNSIYGLDEKAEIVRPETSIAFSSLFTGAIHEPSMFSVLRPK